MGKSQQSLKVTQIMTGKCGKLRRGVLDLPGTNTQFSNDPGTSGQPGKQNIVPLYNSSEHIIFRSIYAYTIYVYQCNSN